MGLRSGYSVVFEASRLTAVLDGLAELLSEQTRPLLAHARAHGPVLRLRFRHGEDTITCGLGLSPHPPPDEDINSVCLCLRLPSDQDWPVDGGMPRPQRGILGCMWTSLYVGERWGMLSIAAATRSLSCWMDDPALVSLLRHHLGGTVSAILLDEDLGELRCLYPQPERRLREADHNTGAHLIDEDGEIFLEDDDDHRWALVSPEAVVVDAAPKVWRLQGSRGTTVTVEPGLWLCDADAAGDSLMDALAR